MWNFIKHLKIRIKVYFCDVFNHGEKEIIEEYLVGKFKSGRFCKYKCKRCGATTLGLIKCK